MRPLRTLVVDDEEAARSLLGRHVGHREDLEWIGEATNGPAAVRAIEALTPDLVLLDIEMPELDGFGVVRATRAGAPPMVVFVTAFDRYAVRAFELQAVDYVLKPVTLERFNQAIDHCLARESRQPVAVTQLQEDALRRPPRRILVRARGRVVPIPVDAIRYIEAQGDYVRVVVKGHKYLLEKTLTEMAALLELRGFTRIHRGTIVNVSKIKELVSLGSGRYALYLDDGVDLVVSRGYSARFRGVLL